MVFDVDSFFSPKLNLPFTTVDLKNQCLFVAWSVLPKHHYMQYLATLFCFQENSK